MLVGKAIVLLAIIALGTWAVHSHQEEILLRIGWIEERELDPFIRAEGFYHTFQYDQAVTAYRQAIAQNVSEPRRQQAWFRTAIALDKAGRKQESIDAYREAIALYPRSDDAARGQAAIERLRVETGQ